MPIVDIILVGVFLVALVIVGLWPGKIHGREAFLISDRRLSGVSSGFTISASKIGGGLLVTYSALVFAFGYEALWLFAGYVIGYALFYIFARTLQKEAHLQGYYTMADFFQTRYGKEAGVVVGVGVVISLTGWIFTNLIVGGDLIAALTELTPPMATLLLAAPIAIYLVYGGFHSVVKTDILQYIAMIVILILIAVAMGSLDTAEVTVQETKTMNIGRIVSFILIGVLFPMGSAELWQRAYATRDRRGLFVGIGIASATFMVFGLALSFISLRLRDVTLTSGATADQLGLVQGVAGALGPIFTGIWIIVFLAVILSSADTFVFTSASSVVEDVMERAGLLQSKHRVLAIRIVILLFCALGIAGALAFKSVVTVTFFYAGITLSLGVVALFAWLTRRLNGIAISAALLVGLGASAFEAISAGVTARTAAVNAGATLAVLLVSLVILLFVSKRTHDQLPTLEK